MEENRGRRIVETTYLSVDNAWRYRAILHFFYVQHERLRHHLFPEEVYQYMKANPQFSSYTEEQLEQDMNQLVKWGNLVERQETGRATSIEEFKKRRCRYQCTPYTVEIERMVQKLERLGESFGGSLEMTRFDRLYKTLRDLTKAIENPFAKSEDMRWEYEALAWEVAELNQTWEDMHGYFRKLVEDASGYIAHMHSEKVEERMMTEAFLVYKDRFTDYLRYFMLGLQRSAARIQAILDRTPFSLIEKIAARLADYQQSIPRLEEPLDAAEYVSRYCDQWKSMQEWFVGTGGREAEVDRLQEMTNMAIRRVTRVVQRMGERHAMLQSRQKDYLHLANWFHRLDTLAEAHELASIVFGAHHTRHLAVNSVGGEDMNQYVWDGKPDEVTVKPRVNTYREKTKPGAVRDRTVEKEQARQAYLEKLEREREAIEQLIKNGRLEMASLPVVEPFVRKTLLHWIGKCLSNEEHVTKTEYGNVVQLIKVDQHRIVLRAKDGEMELPNFVFRVLQ